MFSRVGVWVRQRPGRYWSLVAFTVVATSVIVHDRTAAADRTVARWGRTADVLVARHDVAPGVVVAPSDVETQSLPSALVPSGALTVLERGAVAAQQIMSGEVVRRRRLVPGGVGPIAAQLHATEVGVAVSTGPARPDVEIGDSVELFGVSGATPDAAGSQAVAHGRVVAVGKDQLTVAIPASQASALATAQATAPLLIAVRPHS
jgi:Flp pilus assembly protein CpaB